MDTEAIIIGAGIGGLATAIALQQRGIAVQIFDRIAEFQEVGAGLSLWPNAVKSLQRLDLQAALQTLRVPETAGGIYSAQGRELFTISTTELHKKFGAATIVVHRAELQAAMLAKLDAATIHLNQRLLRFEQNAEKVTAFFDNGEQVSGKLLIGADGIHSVVRQQLFGSNKLRYAGYTAWRGVTSQPQQPLLFGEFWGCGARFGIMPLSENRVYWFAAKNAPISQPDKVAGRKVELLEIFDGWQSSVPAVIAATPPEVILHNDIYDFNPLPEWTRGAVTLLGDAAHAMTPNLGQGACQAMEDAVVLASCLANTKIIPEALQQYQRQRLKRANRIVRQSWQIGKVAQWGNPMACRIRNEGFRLLPASLKIRQVAPIIGYEAT